MLRKLRGNIKVVYLLQVLAFTACGYSSYTERVDFFQGAPIRSVLVLPFVNLSGVANAESELNFAFVSALNKHGWVRAYGKREVDGYLKKRGIKKKLTYDRNIARTLGKLFKVDAVIYGTLLAYMKPGAVVGPDGYTSFSMNVRVLDVRSGKLLKSYSVSKDVAPSLFSSLRNRFNSILNETVNDIVSDLIEGGEG